MAAEERLDGGFVGDVVRIGDTVRRPTGPWTPAVHALLRHLEQAGFVEAPRVLGVDERDREILTFLPGETMPWTDWPAYLRSDEGPAMLGALLRRYHDAVRTFRPPDGAIWRNPLAPTDGELIRHGDFSPFNVVWQGGRPTAVIDWDFAQPGHAITDLAYLAWQVVPLQADGRVLEYGFTDGIDRSARLRELCAAYGAGHRPAEVVDAAVEAIRTEREQTAQLADRGLYPWTLFAADGNVEAFVGEVDWIVGHRDLLVRGGA